MLTPAMQQYYDMKKEYSDSIIFFRMGDFYEMFGEDAHIAHKILGINITTRNKNASNPEPLAGIPYHAKDKYLPLLVEAGYKVAIVEQISDPNLKGIFKREVVRVVTPATLSLEGDMYDSYSERSVLLSISYSENIYGISLLDISSNKWQTTQFQNFDDFQKEIFSLNPSEVILDKKLYHNEKIKEILQKKYSLNIYYFELKGNPEKILLEHFCVKNLSGFGIQDKPQAIESSAILLSYLELNQKQALSQLTNISIFSFGDYLELDSSTVKNLDIIYNFATNSGNIGTLFGVLNHTKTPMGKRQMKNNLIHPLKHSSAIQDRLDFIEECLKNKVLLDKIREKLSYISDIDAILNRMALKRTTPHDLLNLKKSFQAILDIYHIIEVEGSEKLKKILHF